MTSESDGARPPIPGSAEDEISEPQILKRIGATYRHIDAAKIVAASLYEPSSGSRLARFDSLLDWSAPSQLAMRGLSAAADHLDAVRLTLDARRLFPFAQLTLIRSALIGAATTAWMLSPADDDESWRRALRAEHEEKIRLRTYGNDAAPLIAPENRDIAAESRARIEARIRDVGRLAGEMNLSIPNFTNEVLPAATEAAFGSESSLRDHALLVWRAGSGAAHGLVQALLHGPDVRRHDEQGTMAAHTLGGGLTTIADPFMAAFWLSVTGWRLLEKHGGARFAPDVTMRAGLPPL